MKKRKTERQKIIDKLDAVWSLKVKERADFMCEIGGSDRVVSHHIIPKARGYAIRWCLDDGVCIEGGKHFKLHNDPEYAYRILKELISQRGKPWYTRIKKLSNRIVKYTNKELYEILEKLKNSK